MNQRRGALSSWRSLHRSLLLLLSLFLLCRITKGECVLFLGALGIYAALCRRIGWAMVAYLIIPFLMVINPFLLPRSGGVAAYSRVVTVLLAFALVAGNLYGRKTENANDHLPLSGIVLFFLSALVSSVQGIFPLISYFKLLNICFFLMGLYAGTASLPFCVDDAQILRNTILSISCIFVFGSLCALASPAIAYYTSSSYYIIEEGLEGANEILATDWHGMGLFSGITVHSQFLGPVLACMSCWLCCDLFLGNGENRLVHVLLILCIPPMIFMSRSRAGLLAYIVSWIVLAFHFLPRLQVSEERRKRIVTGLLTGFFILASVGTFMQIKNQALSRWIRKTDDVANDTRNLAEAITNSRSGLVARCLSEFKRNPWLGSGFQVMEEHRRAYQMRRISIFSAPVEKGILPLMVLGETGIVGFLFFAFFLFSFFSNCHRQGYVATSTLFLVFLSTNLAESTFFSPSGGGGVMWVICVLGGFTIDMVAKRRHLRRLAPAGFPNISSRPIDSLPFSPTMTAPEPVMEHSLPGQRIDIIPK